MKLSLLEVFDDHPDNLFYHKGDVFSKKFINDFYQSNLPVSKLFKLMYGDGASFHDSLDAFLANNEAQRFIQTQDSKGLLRWLTDSTKLEILETFKSYDSFEQDFLQFWENQASDRLKQLIPLFRQIYGIELKVPQKNWF